MSSDYAIKVSGVGKCYQIYDRPRDRLMQMLLRNKKQYFREFWALKDVSFDIYKGETVGIVGRNGSGKSTLLQIICGTVTPTKGSVERFGRVAALLELGAGFNIEFTGRENILLNAAILGFPREAMQDRMAEVIAFSELSDFIDQPVKTYSSGMYARLAFSIAIHVDPDILIIDEALSVGDARFVAKCMKRIKDIQQSGTTILFVSHDVGSVRTLCERAIWMDQGRVVDQGDVFPVSGRFMEYLFQGEATENIAVRADIASGALLEDAQEQGSSETALTKAEDVALDSRPVTHWGSHKGLILSAAVRDSAGNRKNVIYLGEEFSIVIDVSIPLDVPREHLSVAFSIKNLKGVDLVVSTTRDHEPTVLPSVEKFRVSFSMKNQLADGKYLLVAAVENRKSKDIHYYEYFEGAHYFSCLCEEELFGLFHPGIDRKISMQKGLI